MRQGVIKGRQAVVDFRWVVEVMVFLITFSSTFRIRKMLFRMMDTREEGTGAGTTTNED